MVVLRNFKLSRRTMLRGVLGGAAVSVGLPPLEAMLGTHGDVLADGTALPKRFITFLFGNGVMLDRFEPTTTGPGWELTSQLAPLADVKDYVTVCTGLRNRTGAYPITHHEGMSIFSGHDYAEATAGGLIASDWGGPTIDQVIADSIAARVTLPVRSLQIGISKFDSPADGGTTAKALSARGTPGNLTTLFPERNPRSVWNTLFGEFSAPVDNRGIRLSVLDAVKEETQSLRGHLGAKDKQRLDAHLANIAELETKIGATPPVCDLPPEPTLDNSEPNGSEQLTAITRVMSELIAYAFVCDITRVASVLFLGIAGEATFGELSGTGSHHNHSHSLDEGYHQGIVYSIERYADLLRALRDTPDVDGTNLLDSSLVFCSTEISHGAHQYQRQPIIIGGHGRGWLAHPGVHYQATPRSGPSDFTSAGNTSDVLLTCLQCFDPEADSVGAGPMVSTTPQEEIMA